MAKRKRKTKAPVASATSPAPAGALDASHRDLLSGAMVAYPNPYRPPTCAEDAAALGLSNAGLVVKNPLGVLCTPLGLELGYLRGLAPEVSR